MQGDLATVADFEKLLTYLAGAEVMQRSTRRVTDGLSQRL